MLRKNENWNNRNKYSERDVQEMRQAQEEQRLANDAIEDMYTERSKVVVSGLVSKYGFSEAGASATMKLIEKGCDYMGESYVSNACFATPAMKEAAMKAYNYYHGIKG